MRWKKVAAQALLLAVGTVMLCAGVLRGEAATVTKIDSLPRVHSGSGGSVEQPASAKFSEGRNLSGSRKNSMCAGT